MRPTVADRLPLLLHAYRWLTWGATPLTPLLLGYRLRRGKELRERLRERRAETKVPRPGSPLVWVHGASVGEIIAALALIQRLNAQGFRILVTSGTVTSAELAAQRMPPGVIHQFIPLDAPRYVRRFLDHWRPDLALFMESDLWPNLILAADARKIPLILVNGRLSEQSFQRWRHVPRTIAALLRRFHLCLAQSQDDAQRYAALGAAVNITGNLKIDVPPPPVDQKVFGALESAVDGRPIIAAASTHPGEEAIMIDVHQRLRTQIPNLLTVVAPRHPERGPDIAAGAEAAGLKPLLRSRGDAPDKSGDFYVLDTMGELGLLYRLAPIVFMGGSLASHGGQNPIEAAKLGAAILHGPHVWNFAEIYAALDAANGARQVADGAALAARMRDWLTDTGARQKAALAGRRTVDALGGALDRTLAALDPYLQPLSPVRRRAGDA
jgi:3-deoxy-D-manno-octulosonic-acid transferase